MQPQRNRKTGRRQYTAEERRIRAAIKRRGDDCGICHQPIDYDLPQYDPGCYEVDHILPISRGGKITLENSRPAHRGCNRSRSNRLDADALAAAGGTTPDVACPIGPCQQHRCIHWPSGSRSTLRDWWSKRGA